MDNETNFCLPISYVKHIRPAGGTRDMSGEDDEFLDIHMESHRIRLNSKGSPKDTSGGTTLNHPIFRRIISNLPHSPAEKIKTEFEQETNRCETWCFLTATCMIGMICK